MSATEYTVFSSPSVSLRICPHCFADDPNAFTVTASLCKACVREKNQRWRAAHPDYASIRSKEWRAKNHEVYLVRNRQHALDFYYRHRTQILAKIAQQRRSSEGARIRRQRRLWYAAHRQEIRAYARSRARHYYALYPLKRRSLQGRYRKANGVKVRLWQALRTARKRGLPHTFTLTERTFMLEYFGNTCAACQRPHDLFLDLHDDHWIPLAHVDCPGTVAENMIPLCGGYTGCNNTKSNKDAMAWLCERFGHRKSLQIMQRIQAYFALVRARKECLS